VPWGGEVINFMNIIDEFKIIRDIPYRIPLNYGEEDNCCSGKSTKLLKVLRDLGFKARYRVCVFLWSDLPLPEDLKKIPHDEDCTHTYLEVFLNDKWAIVDPVWDKGLKNIFHINNWDGRSDTEISLKPVKTFSLEKSLSIMENQTEEVINDDLSRNKTFYKALNEWLESQRKNV
jgi:hypothetical protein